LNLTWKEFGVPALAAAVFKEWSLPPEAQA